jgi:hypothetical protein
MQPQKRKTITIVQLVSFYSIILSLRVLISLIEKVLPVPIWYVYCDDPFFNLYRPNQTWAGLGYQNSIDLA